jgi:CPA2 family monovalent cation:H+ antiporter-2
LEAHADLSAYKELLVFLVTAGIVVPVFRRLRLSPVIGFIVAGVALGPFGLGKIAGDWPIVSRIVIGNIDEMAKVAELGVAFLLFMIGLELSFERLRRMRRLVFGLGGAQVALCALAIGYGAWFLGAEPASASVIGCALALSSTAIVMPALAERKRLNAASGRVAFSILLFQDLMVAPFLFMVTMLAVSTGEDGLAGRLTTTLAPAFLGLILLLVVGRLVIRPLFNHVAQARSTEFFVAACLLVITASSVGAAAAGLSMSMGAFIAGLLLAETEYRREVEVTIEPFKGLLLGLFFMTVGAGLDVSRVFASPAQTLGVALALIAGKAAIIYALVRVARFTPAAAFESALVTAPAGEFAFVILGAAAAGGLLAQGLAAQLVLAATLSMIAIPALAWAGARRAKRRTASAQFDALSPDVELSDHVIVVGYGRVGSLVGDMLAVHDIPAVAVDGDPKLVAAKRAEGCKLGGNIYWGDAGRIELLRRCGLAGARALVVTMDSPAVVERIVMAARGDRPDMTIVARARDAAHATHLYELGASDAIPETIEASLQLAEATLVDIGVPMGLVIASIHEKRDEFRALLKSCGPAGERRAIRLSTRVRDMRQRRVAPPAQGAQSAEENAERSAEPVAEPAGEAAARAPREDGARA